MLFMILERFRDPAAVYRRFREHGRMLPDGVSYVASWVTNDRKRCFQVMECAERRQLDDWIARWADLAEFEVVPVMTSAEAAASFAAKE